MYCKPQIVVQLDRRGRPVCVLLLGCGAAVGRGIKDAWVRAGSLVCSFFPSSCIKGNRE